VSNDDPRSLPIAVRDQFREESGMHMRRTQPAFRPAGDRG
jgi:hypothetical protein